MRKSDILKVELMKYFRYEKGMVFVCSEGINCSDINAINDKCLVEVEVKISKADFRREFEAATLNNGNYWKEKKHQFYAHPEQAFSSYKIPNKYYFCVPDEMAAWAMEYLKDKNPKYGLLAYDETLHKANKIKLLKGARQLQKEPPSPLIWRMIGQRVTSEMISLKVKCNEVLKELETVKKGVLITEGIA